MKVYTRGGDEGETSLFGGRRVPKNATRIQAIGEVDELNATLGLARSELDAQDLDAQLHTIQSSLFDLGGQLATPDPGRDRSNANPRVRQSDVDTLEGWIDALETELEPLRNFILPGGVRGAASLHLGRTVCRRAERQVLTLHETEKVDPVLLRYLNRLSDLLFVMARVVNRRAGMAEPQWIGRQR